jgi:gluconate 2-dehydrogenase gamma chain
MKRRELLRAGVLTGAAAALWPPTSTPQQTQNAENASGQPSELTPAQSGVDASKDLAAPNWKPLFFDDHQNETLIILSDLIIPATSTPGAKEALVNRYIDLVLAADTHENQRAFLNSLSYLDGESMRRYKSAFRYLSREDQDDLLHSIAYPSAGSGWTGEAATSDIGHMHFENLKEHIGIAFYNSQIGTRELGWDGNFTHGVYQGCDHPEGNHK